jgi:hypothetical protein
MLKNIIRKYRVAIMLVAMFALNAGFIPNAFALTYVTKPQIILTNMNAAGAGPIIFSFTTSASNTGTSLAVAFTGYTGGAAGAVAATQTYSGSYNGATCQSITGAGAALPGAPAASGNAATGVITFSGITAYTASTSYCGVLTAAAAVTNPTATGQYAATITAGSDSATNVEVDVITNDQVVVSATVLPTFTMALSANADTFGNLAPATVGTTTGVTATINTNAKNGWTLYGSDSNTGLRSTTQSKTIASVTPGTNTTLTAGTEGYVSAVTAASISQGTGGGVTTANAAYTSAGLGQGSGLDTSARPMASSTGTATNAIVPVKEYAAVSTTTPPASDYSDTITLVAAGKF